MSVVIVISVPKFSKLFTIISFCFVNIYTYNTNKYKILLQHVKYKMFKCALSFNCCLYTYFMTYSFLKKFQVFKCLKLKNKQNT